MSVVEKLEEGIKKHVEVLGKLGFKPLGQRLWKEFVAFKKAEVLKIEKIKRMKGGEHGFDFTPSYLTLHKTVDAILEILDKPPMEACVIVPRKQLEKYKSDLTLHFQAEDEISITQVEALLDWLLEVEK